MGGLNLGGLLGGGGGASALTGMLGKVAGNAKNIDPNQVSTMMQSGMSAAGDAMKLLQEPETKDLLQQGMSGVSAFFSGDMQGAMQAGMGAMKDVVALAGKDETKDLVGNAITMGVCGGQIGGTLMGADLSGIDAGQMGSMGKDLYGKAIDMFGGFAGNLG